MSNLPGQGRKPKPAVIKLLEGNRGKRPINEGPKFRPGMPKCPEWLTADAKEEWARLAPELERLGLLTTADTNDFAGYCQSYARWKEAELLISANGFTVTSKHMDMDEDGRVYERIMIRTRPEVGVAERAKMAMLRFGALFGFSPADRGRINVNEPAKEDELERMIE